MSGWKLKLKKVESRSLLEIEPRYRVILNGQDVGELYFNMHGYVGRLPTPSGAPLVIGERSIGAYRKEVAALNREAKEMLS
jgi:hypothetical protein